MNSPAVAVFGIQPHILALAHAASYADLELRGIWSPEHPEALKYALLLGTSAFPDPVRLFDSLDARALVICAEEYIGELPTRRPPTAGSPYTLVVGRPDRQPPKSSSEVDENRYHFRMVAPDSFPLDRVLSAPLPLRARLGARASPTAEARKWLDLLRVEVEKSPREL